MNFFNVVADCLSRSMENQNLIRKEDISSYCTVKHLKIYLLSNYFVPHLSELYCLAFSSIVF